MTKTTAIKEAEPIWMRVESAGVDVSVLTNALKIGQVALEDYGTSMWKELNDYFFLLIDYSKAIETEINDITECLRAEHMAKKVVG